MMAFQMLCFPLITLVLPCLRIAVLLSEVAFPFNYFDIGLSFENELQYIHCTSCTIDFSLPQMHIVKSAMHACEVNTYIWVLSIGLYG